MADASVDKSLDQIIKERHISARRPGRGGPAGGRGGLRGGMRRRPGGGPAGARGGPKLVRNGGAGAGRRAGGGIQKRRSGGLGGSPAKAAAIRGDGQWNHDLYQNSGGASAVVTSGPAKLVISNLDFGVNDSDIKGLFQEFGQIRKAAVHYDRSGRSLGTADVVFEKRGDAVKALRKYNGVSLDGRPMNIQLTASLVPSQSVGGANGGGAPRSPRRQPIGGAGGAPRRRGGPIRRGGGGGGPRGAPREKKPQKTAAEMDAELEAYASKMQTD